MEKRELLKITIVYRFFSILASTTTYLALTPGGLNRERILIVCGMLTACIIGAFLYIQNYSSTAWAKNVTLALELVAYGVLLVLSGGFASAYLWYFASVLAVIIAMDRETEVLEGNGDTLRGKIPVLSLISVLWCVLCGVVGIVYFYPDNVSVFPELNAGIGFVILTVGFYMLAVHVCKVEKSSAELSVLNRKLSA